MEKMTDRERFWPLFWTQFLGAFNDNYFKNSLVILITFRAVSLMGLSTEQLVAMCGGIFILPFFLFSAIAGQISDRFEKSKLVRIIKVTELCIMGIAVLGFLRNDPALLLLVLFLMGAQSAFFGPIKYSYLPQLMNEAELVNANAIFQMGTFIAILLGTGLGGIAIAVDGYGEYLAAGGVVFFAILGIIASRFVRPVPNYPEVKIALDPIRPTLEMIRLIAKNRSVFLSILGMTWFWFFGSAVLSMFPSFGKDYLAGNEHVVTLFLTLFSIGIGAGSMLCDRLSGRQLEVGLVPLGCLGMTLASLDLYFASFSIQIPEIHSNSDGMSVGFFLTQTYAWRIAFDLFMLSLSGGLFMVPLMTLIQERSNNNEVARVIAGNNIMGALGMVSSAVLLMVLYELGLTIPQIFLLYGILNLAVGIYIFLLIPEFTLRFYVWILSKILYRVRYEGKEKIPETGAAILTCNHITFVDWLIIQSASRRPIRFIMHYRFMNIPFTGWLFRLAGVIPIASKKEKPEILIKALQEAEDTLNRGELLCIFPEGTLSKDGEIGVFRPGVERIVEKTGATVVPMALSGMWESLFSRNPTPLWRRFPGKFLAHVRLHIGNPISPQDLTAEDLRTKVAALLDAADAKRT